MPDDTNPSRNLHTTISPTALRLLGAQARLEGRQMGDVLDAAILAYAAKLAAAAADAKGTKDEGGSAK